MKASLFFLLLSIPIYAKVQNEDFSQSVNNGKNIYEKGCAACHSAGVAGAPMLANKIQWEKRLAKGTEMLVNNAWSGIGGMPAKGLCGDCTKEEITLAVQYMLNTL